MLRFLLFPVLLLLTAAAPLPAQVGPRPAMRILVTNDDGVHSEGIAALVAALRPIADVTVAAPAENHSGGSQSVTLFSRALEVETLDAAGARARYSVRGTPTDSVIFGLLGPGREHPFDLVISGINKGENVGDAVPVSGTIGAARQAAMMGVPAIAVSQQFTDEGRYDYTLAAASAAELAQTIHRLGDHAPRLVSINVPTVVKGVRFVPAGGKAFGMSGLRKLEDGKDPTVTRYRVDFSSLGKSEGVGDAAALTAGYMTVTVLSLDPNDREATLALCREAAKPTGAAPVVRTDKNTCKP